MKKCASAPKKVAVYMQVVSIVVKVKQKRAKT